MSNSALIIVSGLNVPPTLPTLIRDVCKCIQYALGLKTVQD